MKLFGVFVLAHSLCFMLSHNCFTKRYLNRQLHFNWEVMYDKEQSLADFATKINFSRKKADHVNALHIRALVNEFVFRFIVTQGNICVV